MSFKKFNMMIAVILVLILSLTACSGSKKTTTNNSAVTKAPTTNKADADTIDLSGITLRFGATGWGLQEALLKAAGLDDTPYKVEYTVFQGGNLCLEAMAADQIDLTGSSEIPPVFASLAENGGNFKIIAINNSNTQLQELIIPSKSTIKTVADLKGKKVGFIKSTTAQYFLYQMLKEAGLGWKDIDAVEITTADGVTALLGGELDAFASYGNSINAAKNNGATTLASAENILSGNFPFEASDSALSDPKLRAAIVDYLARIELAYQWQQKHVEEWAKISADPTGTSYEENLAVLKKGYEQRETHIKTISNEIIQSEQKIADTFLELGLLEKKVDASALYDNSLSEDYNKALTRLSK